MAKELDAFLIVGVSIRNAVIGDPSIALQGRMPVIGD